MKPIMSVPPVTVLMSAYNAEKFVREAVESVLCQSFSDFEFLVFDDASNDSTAAILSSFSDPRLKVIRNEHNLGLTVNLAKGMEKARGEFVVRMDADDVCLPDRIERQVAFLRAHPEVGLAGCAAVFYGEGLKDFTAHQSARHEDLQCELFFGYALFHPSVILRKSSFDANGLNYDPHFTCSQDHDLWVRASRVMKLAAQEDALVRMRLHGSRIGVTRKDVQTRLSNEIRARQFAELGLAPTEEERDAFNAAASGVGLSAPAQFRAFESVVLKIVGANRERRIFDQAALERAAGHSMFGACRGALLAGNRAGAFFWRSRLRAFAQLTPRLYAGLIYRTLRCLVWGKRA